MDGASLDDGAVVSDWPGWRRLKELDPACVVDVPMDPSTALPKLSWRACTDGRANCLEVDTTGFRPGPATIFFGRGWTNGPLTSVARLVTDLVSEVDVIDRNLGTFVTGIRRTAPPACSSGYVLGPSTAVLLGFDSAGRYALAHGTLQLLTTAPVPIASFQVSISMFGSVSVDETNAANDKLLAFDLQPAGRVVRVPLSNPSARTLSNPGKFLAHPSVVEDDVYIIEQDGTGDGWSRIVRMDPDGTLVPWRAVPNHRVRALAYDAGTVYWSECYGLADPKNLAQPNVEVWSAPYTRDPSVLAQTAQKLADLPGAYCLYDEQVIAQNGIFLAVSSANQYAVRSSDKKVLTFQNGGTRLSWYPLVITQAEYWSIEAVANGPRGVALTRLALPAW